MSNLQWFDINGSSNISRIAYDGSLELAYVEFLDNSIYIYPWVNLVTWGYFVAAPSKGAFRHRYLKYGIKVFDPNNTKPATAREFLKLLVDSIEFNEIKQ